MTLRTLKPKENNSLILDDEFLQYCKLNNIEDIEKFAREVFNQGFTIIKYGKVPSDTRTESAKKKWDKNGNREGLNENVIDIVQKNTLASEKNEIVVPKVIKKQVEQEQIQNMKKKADLYDE